MYWSIWKVEPKKEMLKRMRKEPLVASCVEQVQESTVTRTVARKEVQK
jgi:hypothetical protein